MPAFYWEGTWAPALCVVGHIRAIGNISQNPVLGGWVGRLFIGDHPKKQFTNAADAAVWVEVVARLTYRQE